MVRPLSFSVLLVSLFAAGCSRQPTKDVKVYSAGEKAAIGNLTYTMIDAQMAASLGDDPANPRTPQNRFYIIQLTVSNSGNEDAVIPATMLVDDSGKTYPELGDGTGVPGWLGLLRKVSPAQTEQGTVVFDAPPTHYRLRLTEEGDDDVSMDIPVSFVHEEAHGVPPGSANPLPPTEK